MIWTPWGMLHSSQGCDFRSAFDVAESVARLQAATTRFEIGALTRQAAVGPVSESDVCLRRVIPLIRNDFKPHFYGRFELRADGVYLTGRFQMPLMVRVGMWLGLAALIVLLMLPGLPGDWRGVLIVSGMFVGGVALIALCRWLSRNDPAWLSGVIREALGTPQAPV